MNRQKPLSYVLPLALLLACNTTPTSNLKISADQNTIAEEGFLPLTAKLEGSNDSLNWDIISGPGTLLADTGSSIVYEAPSLTQNQTVRVRASSASNPSIFGDFDFEVRAPLASQQDNLGVLGGTVKAGEVTAVFEPGALKASAGIELETNIASQTPLLSTIALDGPIARLEIPSSAIDGLEDKRLTLTLPAPTGDHAGVAEVRIIREDGTSFGYIEAFTSENHVYEISTALLNKVNLSAAQVPALQNKGQRLRPKFIGGLIRVIISPVVDKAKELAEKAADAIYPSGFVTEPREIGQGLLQFENAFSIADLNSSDCTSSRQVQPTNRLRWAWAADGKGAGPENIGNKIPLVLVHGWQAVNDLRFKSLNRDERTFPGFCNWTNFLEAYYGDNGAALREKYALFSFSYNSYRRVSGNGNDLRNALKATFGDRPVVALAHSMGGLVTNAAVGSAPSSFAKVVTLATPYQGSIALECAEANAQSCEKVKLNSDIANRIALLGTPFYFAIPTLGPILAALPNGTVGNYLARTVTVFDGTKDLAWEFGKAKNPFLTATNTALTPSILEKYTGFYGTGDEASTKFKVLGLAIRGSTSQKNDGIVGVSSGCLSQESADNTCSKTRLSRLNRTAFDHGQIQSKENFDGIKSVLLGF
jgi:pimeloyl-ACP methyl ester carboxylesterase